MTTEADFTPDEWNLLLSAPAFAALYIVQSDRHSRLVAYQKMMAGIWAILETAMPDTSSKLIGAVRAALHAGQRPRYPEHFPEDRMAVCRLSLEQCRQAAAILSRRAPDSEAVAYATWLLAIGEAVAAVPDEAFPSGQRITRAAEHARMALEDLAITLSIC